MFSDQKIVDDDLLKKFKELADEHFPDQGYDSRWFTTMDHSYCGDAQNKWPEDLEW